MAQHRFDVYGRTIEVRRDGQSWRAFTVGADGTLSPADFEIPDFVEAQELAQYLDDLFHESATPRRGAVRRID